MYMGKAYYPLYRHKSPHRHKCSNGHLLYRHIIFAYSHFAYNGINVYIGMNAHIGINAYIGMGIYAYIVGIYAFKVINAHMGINAYIDIHAYMDIDAYIRKMLICINDMPI